MKRKGFTLIELLAVIIILGILMLIAIPSVTSYINNSRKNTYVSSISEVIKGAIAKVNSGDVDMFDTDTTYYIPISAIELESGDMKSPYADMDEAYVVVTYDGEDYDYYFVGKDKADMGISEITRSDKINKDSIGEVRAIDTTVGIEGKSKVVVFDSDLVAGPSQTAGSYVSGMGGTSSGGSSSGGSSNTQCIGNECKCKRATTLHTSSCNKHGICEKTMSLNTAISYGNLGSGNTISVGDAYDCDVNGDGTYDPETERFYYVTTEDNYAVLLYYNNTMGGVPHPGAVVSYYVPSKEPDKYTDCSKDLDVEEDAGYWQFHAYINYEGPKGALGYTATYASDYGPALPTTSQWSNVSLRSTTRAIVGPNGETTIAGHTLPTNFSYAGYAARLLTYQEVVDACDVEGSYMDPKCSFMVENSAYDYAHTQNYAGDVCLFWSSVNYGFFLETPQDSNYTSIDGSYHGNVYYVSASRTLESDNDVDYGIRPAIEVPLNKVEK